MKTEGNTGVAQQGFGQYCLNVLVAQKMKMKPFLWNYGMFVTQKSCVKKFGGGNINKIYSGTISYADVNTMPHCLTSDNNHAIKLYNAING